MKKLIAIILAIALILPAAALAADKEVSEFYGYAHINIEKDGSPYMSTIYFGENQTCYYFTQMFHAGETGFGRAYVGIWGYTADGDVFAKVGNSESAKIVFAITESGAIVDRASMDVFEPINARLD